MPRQTSLQITEAQERQIEALKGIGYGTLTDIFRIALDRFYREESKMQYKGWTIETFGTIGGFGWSATHSEYGAMGRPNASQNDHTTYTSEENALHAAKVAITKFLDGYHYEGEAKF